MENAPIQTAHSTEQLQRAHAQRHRHAIHDEMTLVNFTHHLLAIPKEPQTTNTHSEFDLWPRDVDVP